MTISNSLSTPTQAKFHYPGHKLFKTNFNLIPKFVQNKIPLKTVTVFTDGSGSSHKSIMTWRDPRTQEWESDVRVVEGSPQNAELAAIVRAFEKFKDQSFNLVTDSAHVAAVAEGRACFFKGGIQQNLVFLAF